MKGKSLQRPRVWLDNVIVLHRWPDRCVAGLKATRQKEKRADYLLRYTPDFTIAVVKAKVLTVANKGR